MNLAKKITLIVASVIILIATGFGIWWIVSNWKNLTSSTQLYTYQEMQDYGDARADEEREKWEQVSALNDTLKLKISVAEENVNKLTIEREKDKATINTLKSSVNEKDEQITALNAQIEILNTDKEQNLAEIENLTNEKTQLENEKSTLLLEIENLNNQVKEKEAEITNLQNEVVRLTAELEAYKDQELTGLYKCEFLNGEVVEAVVYTQETKALPYIPVIENTQTEWFYGWTTTEGSNVVEDLTNFVPTENTTFYAVTGECVSVLLVCGNREEYIRVGANLTVSDLLSFNGIETNEHVEISLENIRLVNDDKSIYYFQPTFDTVLSTIPDRRIFFAVASDEDGNLLHIYGKYIKVNLNYHKTSDLYYG